MQHQYKKMGYQWESPSEITGLDTIFVLKRITYLNCWYFHKEISLLPNIIQKLSLFMPFQNLRREETEFPFFQSPSSLPVLELQTLSFSYQSWWDHQQPYQGLLCQSLSDLWGMYPSKELYHGWCSAIHNQIIQFLMQELSKFATEFSTCSSLARVKQRKWASIWDQEQINISQIISRNIYSTFIHNYQNTMFLKM